MIVNVWYSVEGAKTRLSDSVNNYRVPSRAWSEFLRTHVDEKYFHGKTIAGDIRIEKETLEKFLGQFPNDLKNWW